MFVCVWYLLQITEKHVMDIWNIFYPTKTDKQGTYFDIAKTMFKTKQNQKKKN
jgi:hypothetical protein